MESANLHNPQQHHQLLPDQLVASSSPLSTSSCYGVGSTHAWTSKTILNSGFNPNINEVSISSGDSSRQQNDNLAPSANSSMIHDLGFNWAVNGGGAFSSTQSAYDLHLARIKEELSDSYQKFSELVNSATTVQDFQSHPTSYLKNEHKDLNDYPSTTEKLLLRNLSSGSQLTGLQPSGAGDYYSNCGDISRNLPTASRGRFSQIFPTINISNLNQSSPIVSSPSNVNTQATDYLTSARFCGNLGQLSHGHFGVFSKESSLFYGLDHVEHPSHKASNNSTKASNFSNEVVTEATRNSNALEPKAVAKRPRLESRVSCPPLKVRKEKLGDRIAALQQLVAPFGKTDTASVLKEAIGYINFLQNQVETLTVPYMKSSRNKNSRTMKVGLGEDVNEEAKRDLKSRGLCLVPLSFLSYVTDAGGVWSHPSFSGGI